MQGPGHLLNPRFDDVVKLALALGELTGQGQVTHTRFQGLQDKSLPRPSCPHPEQLICLWWLRREKHLPTMRETWVRSLGREDHLEKEMATDSSSLAWKIPGTKEPGGLQSMGSQRVGHDFATSFCLWYQVNCWFSRSVSVQPQLLW